MKYIKQGTVKKAQQRRETRPDSSDIEETLNDET
jgi:hypothetical protein